MTTQPLDRLAAALTGALRGEARFDHFSRVLYSTDASLYQIMPLGVVLPRDAADIATTLRLCADAGVPVLPRGGGTSLAGQSIGPAVVVDCSRYMDGIVAIDPDRGEARVQPGVVQEDLNLALAPHGLRLGPDTATSNRATLGGMIGNNSAGARSIVYGKMVDHVLAATVMLAGGDEMRCAALDDGAFEAKRADRTREGAIYRTVAETLEAQRAEIDRRFPKILRRVAGYNLPEMLARPFNLARLIVGSEGTLGIVTEATVRIVPHPAHTALGILHFADLFAALEAIPAILAHGPSAVELLDRMVLEMTRAQVEFARRMTFVEGDPAALLIVEFSGDTVDEVRSRLEALGRGLRAQGLVAPIITALEPAAQDNVWRVRKAGQGLLQGMRGEAKPITFVEDTAVPPERLAAYMRRFGAILEQHGVRAAFYAHASVGCLHVRPLLNMKDARDIERMRAIALAVGELVIEFGGAMSGEHGDGIVRGWFLERFFGPDIYAAFRSIKRAFDPEGLMNPGKIVESPPMTEQLRYGAAYATAPVPTHFDWSREGGFAAGVELCSGVGACRKTQDGTMCPSYMVTREEEHSTRGRANLLRAALSGALPVSELRGRRMYEALDLCLECKGCKVECPANVDMAKLKYEFLAGYYEANGLPLRARLFGRIHTLSRMAAKMAPASNWIARTSPVRWLLDRAVGVDRRRPLPPLARQTFDAWWRARGESGAGDPSRRVVLFADTFLRYNYPEIGRAAVTVLEALGYQVVVPPVTCCGRPMISKGLLRDAKKAAATNIRTLLPYARAGLPIVGCEPSCLLTFRDEVPDLLPGDEARAVATRALLIDEFLHRHIQNSGWPAPIHGRALLHGHCHQKALVGVAAAAGVLGAVGFETEVVDSGCCGMAGSFGFEREHYDISMAIGERRLLPAVRRQPADVEIVAMGVSCRQQIHHGTGRRARHLVEVLAHALDRPDPDRSHAAHASPH